MSRSDPLSTLGVPSHMLEAMIGGKSAIDIPKLELTSLDEAEAFLECYGFDWNEPQHRMDLSNVRRQALQFMDEELLTDGVQLEIPEEIIDQRDIRQLLLWASRDRDALRQAWSCSLLRVMHTLTHCESYFNLRFGEQIRDQILARFEPHLDETEDGVMLGRGPLAIQLARFEIKRSKPIRSLAMKLLHKVENVTTDVFDRIGVRFVTRERLDALLVVRYLRLHNVVMFANIKPSRSRNTLLDLDLVRRDAARIDDEIRAGRMAEYKRLDALRRAVRGHSFPAPPHRTNNSFSSVAYHALQFTCRQQIRVRNPFEAELDELLHNLLPRYPEGDALADALLQRLRGKQEIRFYFPFEVQILDEQSYEISRSGLAAHDVYKRRQRDAVRKRVLGRLLNAQPGASAG